MCWEEEWAWYNQDEEEKVPVDISWIDVEPKEVQEPTVPEAA